MDCDINLKPVLGKNTQKVNKQKFVFRKIGCLQEVNEKLIIYKFIHSNCRREIDLLKCRVESQAQECIIKDTALLNER